MNFLKRKKQEVPQLADTAQDNTSLFSSHQLLPNNVLGRAEEMKKALAKSFPVGRDPFSLIDPTSPSAAMDSNFSSSKAMGSVMGVIPDPQLAWYGQQGFIGWQACALLSQNWLIDKICTIPADDAIRHGWENSITRGADDTSTEVLSRLKELDKKFQIKRQCRQFVKNERIFGIRHALFIIDGIDYSLPFNIDGVKPGAYKGIVQIDPYWMAPMFDGLSAADPLSFGFYDPTWWMVNGRKIHKTHFVIARNGNEVPDILKPAYFYGGIPTTQKVYERVFGADRCANEAPMLLMTKRLTSLQVDLTQAGSNAEMFAQRMEQFAQLQNNFGVKVVGTGDTITQFDTTLAGVDETIMTQFQLVCAAANVPATKVLATSPKGFNATGEYDESSYHEYLESIQEHDLTPLVDRHNALCVHSYIAPAMGIKPMSIELAWKPVDSPTALERADLNNKKADTDAKLALLGAVDGFDVRQRLIGDPDSGYNGIAEMVPGGPGDREHEQEVSEQLLNNTEEASETREKKQHQVF